MNLPARILKQNARILLTGKYMASSAIVLMASAISLLLTYLQEFSGFSPLGDPTQKLLYWVMNAIILVLEAVLSIGITYFFLQMALGKPFVTGCLFYCFTHDPDRFIVAAALRYALLALGWIPAGFYYFRLPPLLECAPGQLLALLPLILLAVIWDLPILLLYGQSFYILLEDPSCKVAASMEKSRRLMTGHKKRLFFLYVSFVGYGLLELGSFGVGMLWVRPYLEAVKVQFYLDITGRKLKNLTPPDTFPIAENEHSRFQ